MKVEMHIDQSSYEHTIDQLWAIDEKIGRRAVRKGVTNAAKITQNAAKSRAPRGKTGLFRRSMGYKILSSPKRMNYIALVGQKEDKKDSQRAFPTKTREIARRKNHGLSTGISGTGRVVPIWFIEGKTLPHPIPKVGSTRMAMIPGSVKTTRGGDRPGRLSDVVFLRRAMHPGKKATGFLGDASRASQGASRAAIQQEVEAAARSMGVTS